MADQVALHELTALQAAEAIRARAISPVELVQALLDRAAAVDPHVQAWETLDGDGALAAARQAEAALARSGFSPGPLHGVPFGAKDIVDTAGVRTACGFGPWNERVPERSAVVVENLQRAGGILLGKLVTTPFAFVDPPRTRNPWSAAHTPGGSSSGSGAGVAARLVPMALGTQTVGSILRPAAYNGVVGFKPTWGRVNAEGVLPLAWSLDHVGVLARCAADCALYLRAAVPTGKWRQWEQPPPPRLGVWRELVERAAPAVRENTDEVVRTLAAAGAEVRDVVVHEPFDTLQAVLQVTLHAEAAATHWSLLEQHPGAHGPRIRALAEAGRLVPAAAYVQAQRLRARIRAALDQALDGLDAILLPTASDLPPGPETTGDGTFQAPFSLAGMPAISLPSGRSPERLPYAIQLAGRRGDDDVLIGVSGWCERHLAPLPSPQ